MLTRKYVEVSTDHLTGGDFGLLDRQASHDSLPYMGTVIREFDPRSCRVRYIIVLFDRTYVDIHDSPFSAEFTRCIETALSDDDVGIMFINQDCSYDPSFAR